MKAFSRALGVLRDGMSIQPPTARSDTAELIMDVAETLIQTRGYNGFSYQDVAEAIGIRKASIHYHFASKTDLGVAVLDRYSGRIEAGLAQLRAEPDVDALTMLQHYAAPFLEFAKTSERVCLCGALAGELLSLPAEMRDRVKSFFADHQRWLAEIIERGQGRGEIAPTVPARETARSVFSMLQGALLVQRATGDASQLSDVLRSIRRQLVGTEG